MSEPVLNISERDRAQGLRDSIHQGFQRARLGRPQNRLDFRPAQFNRVEVRRIGRQEFQACSLGFNQLTDGFAGMGRQVIHHQDVAPAQGREQLRAHIGFKCDAMDGAFKDPRGADFLPAQRGNQGVMRTRITGRGSTTRWPGAARPNRRVKPKCAPLSSRNFRRFTNLPKLSTNRI